MIIILIRSILIYTILLISLRLMGKAELSQMQPFEFVIILMLAEHAALPMEDLGIPLINGFIAIFTLLIIQITVSYISLKSNLARKIICGKPSILINKGKIDEKEMRRLRININDLIEQLRIKDYPSLGDVEYAILETNGEISIIPKHNKKVITREDMKCKSSSEEIPLSLIIDGTIIYRNLTIANFTEDWLIKQLKKRNISKPKYVFYAYLDKSKKLHFQTKKDVKE